MTQVAILYTDWIFVALSVASSPRSESYRIDKSHQQEKAELVLEALVAVLHSPTHLAKISSALPLPRTYLLLLGDKPSTVVARQVLILIGLSLKASTSFIRKFELVSGWAVLRTVLPAIWDLDLQNSAFDILLGRVSKGDHATSPPGRQSTSLHCPNIFPSILSALNTGLATIMRSEAVESHGAFLHSRTEPHSFVTLVTSDFVEPLIEELMDLQSTSPTFRQIFKSHQTSALFINSYSFFITNIPSARLDERNFIRILEKINHFALALTLDAAMTMTQKQEVGRCV